MTGTRTTQRRRRKRRTRLLAFAAIVGLTTGGGWWFWGREPAGSLSTKPTSATVLRRDFTTSVLATGAVQPQVGAEVQVGARISGKVVRLVSNIGDHVTKGQIVAELKKTDLEAVVAQRQAELELAQAGLAAVDSLLPKEVEKAQLDLDESQATYTLAEKNLGRARKLGRRNVTTEDEIVLLSA